MDAFEPAKYISSLIAASSDGAKSAQPDAFALVGLYLLATAFSTIDEDLLLDRTLAISQRGAPIPVTASFAMMPFLLVALHVLTLTVHNDRFRFVAWVVIAGFPMVAPLAVQIDALLYQSEVVTLVQRLCRCWLILPWCCGDPAPTWTTPS
jgi:hypothetical protein